MASTLEAKVLDILKKQKKAAISLKELIKKAGISKSNREALLDILLRLVKNNRLLDMHGRYVLTENLGLLTAQIVKVNATFGFARAENSQTDAFVPGKLLLGAMPGDVVLLRQKRGTGELPEGEVFKILQRADTKFTGVLVKNERECVIIPDRYVKFPIKMDRAGVHDLHDGDKIIAQIKSRGERHSDHIATLVEGFGSALKASACCASILAANDIYPEFPEDALEQAQAIAAGVGIHPKELAMRLDLRGEPIFTMDGADTKDIDDAVSLNKTAAGWELGVHIADVSYYVTHKTPIDQEAYLRGTSVYYADKVVPMLPKELSNGICSLNPGEDRLAFSAFIDLDDDAKILRYRFVKTVINSRIKGVYSEINAVLDNSATPEILEKYKDVTGILTQMAELAKSLTKNRYARGGMDLSSVESKIIVDENDNAVDIMPRKTGVSENMIEEFMLVANEAAARFAIQERLPFVYRVHDIPATDKLARLYDVLQQLGVPFQLPKGKVGSTQLAAILNKLRGTGLEPIVNTMMLRAMAKAKYSAQNIGHFGLALADYTHFTSPIRRYPDLTIHRILSAKVTGMKHENISKRFAVFAEQSASHSSVRELAAMAAERDCEACYKAEYMQKHIGEQFGGVVTSVTQFGLYVQLPNTAEGFVRTTSLTGDWQFDGSITLSDTKSAKKLRIGDTVRITVTAADVSAGQIDFELA